MGLLLKKRVKREKGSEICENGWVLNRMFRGVFIET